MEPSGHLSYVVFARLFGWRLLAVAPAVLAVSLVIASETRLPHAAPAERFGALAAAIVAVGIAFPPTRDLAVACVGLRSTRALELVALAAVMGAGAWIRLEFLAGPMRFDESFTFLRFVMQPANVSLANYSSPNNHPLNTLLMHLSWSALGDAEEALRLPAYVAGVLTVPATYLAGRVLYGGAAGLLAAAFTAASPALVEYSVNGRGYSLVCLSFALVIGLGAHLVRHPSPFGWCVWAAIAALGFFAIPLFAIALAIAIAYLAALSVVAFAGAARGARLTWCMGAGLAAGIAALFLYQPLLGQSGWKYTYPWPGTATLARQVWDSWNGGFPSLLSALMVGGLVASLGLVRRNGRLDVPLAAVAAIVVALVVLVAPVAPAFARTWVFLVIPYVLAAGRGLTAVIHLGSEPRVRAVVLVAVLALAGFAGGRLSWSDLPTGDDPPMHGAQHAARFLKSHLQLGDAVVVANHSVPIAAYYLRRAGIDWQSVLVTQAGQLPRRAGVVYLFVNRNRDETPSQLIEQLDLPSSVRTWTLVLAANPGVAIYRLCPGWRGDYPGLEIPTGRSAQEATWASGPECSPNGSALGTAPRFLGPR